LLLKKTGDGVERSSRPAAGEEKTVAFRLNDELFGSEFIE
jgi:hypothetical protein